MHKTRTKTPSSGKGRGGKNNRRPKQRPTPPDGAQHASQAPFVHSNGKFSAHWSADETAQKLELGQCFHGKFRVNAKNLDEAYITIKGLPHEVLVRGKHFQNRAMVDDTVAIRILPPHYWWVQKSLLEMSKSINYRGKLDLSGDIYAMDDRIRRMALLRKELGVGLERRQGGDTGKIRTASVWDHAESHEEALELICEILKCFPELRPTGEVIRIMQESPRRNTLMGILQIAPKAGDLHFLPMDACLPKRFVVSVDSLKADRQRLVEEAEILEKENRTILRAEFLRWEQGEEFPSATVHDVLGPTGDLEVETTAILESRGIIEKPFSPEILESLPEVDWTPSNEEISQRLDFRKNCVFTIDPPTARDLDDALSIEKIENDDDLYKIGVHIADVSHFVTPGIELDREAEKRTTSIYLVQRMIPMLPERLSADLCSLNAGQDRLTFSVFWMMRSSGEVLSHEINKTIIHSCGKLSYHHAQEVIENPDALQPTDLSLYGGHTWDKVKSNILTLFNISLKLKKQRQENGALRLDLPKLAFSLDDKGLPMETHFCVSKEANHLIEEFMLLANMTVARTISDMYPSHSLLRHHPSPSVKQFTDLVQVAKDMGIDLDVSTAGSMQRGLKEIHQKVPDADILHSIINMATKPMQLAEYFCTGVLERPQWRHFALSVERYTHFTSPIRRYPDIIVHRLLYATMTVGRKLNDTMDREQSVSLQMTAEACNRGKLSAKNAQEESQNLFLMHWLEKRPVHTMAVVANLKGPKFFDLFVPDFALTTRIHCDDLPGKIQSHFDRNENLLTVQKTEEDAFYNDQQQISHFSSHLVAQMKKVCLELVVHGDQVSVHLHPTPKIPSHSDRDPIFQESVIPMCFPFTIKRFQKVPVKVCAKRCVIFGRLMDVSVELLIDHTKP